MKRKELVQQDIQENFLDKLAGLLSQNFMDNEGNTPLHKAADNGDQDMVKLLLKNGAGVNIANKKGETPLYIATYNGNQDMVKLLLDNGADVDKANKNGNTSLYLAADKGAQDIVNLLLENGANVNIANGYGDTPLYGAAYGDHTNIIKVLLDNGADVNHVNKFYYTPLSIISSNEKPFTWFKEQFTKDSLSKYNNIGKFELLRGLYYIKYKPDIIDSKDINIKDVDSYITKIGTACIKGAFEDIKKDINSLSVYGPNNRVKALSKVNLINDLIKQFQSFNDLKVSEIINQDLNIYNLIYDINKDIHNKIEHAKTSAKNNTSLYKEFGPYFKDILVSAFFCELDCFQKDIDKEIECAKTSAKNNTSWDKEFGPYFKDILVSASSHELDCFQKDKDIDIDIIGNTNNFHYE